MKCLVCGNYGGQPTADGSLPSCTRGDCPNPVPCDPEALPPGAGEKRLSADPSRGVLNERQKTHGPFSKNAEISQELKFLFMRHMNNMASMPAEQKEALDMIALKLSRILSGQANYADHWTDIAGYAKLAEEACK